MFGIVAISDFILKHIRSRIYVYRNVFDFASRLRSYVGELTANTNCFTRGLENVTNPVATVFFFSEERRRRRDPFVESSRAVVFGPFRDPLDRLSIVDLSGKHSIRNREREREEKSVPILLKHSLIVF